MRIHVDRDLCQGHGACKSEAPAVFDVDEKRGTVILLQEAPPEAARTAVLAAVKYCPTRALRVDED